MSVFSEMLNRRGAKGRRGKTQREPLRYLRPVSVPPTVKCIKGLDGYLFFIDANMNREERHGPNTLEINCNSSYFWLNNDLNFTECSEKRYYAIKEITNSIWKKAIKS